MDRRLTTDLLLCIGVLNPCLISLPPPPTWCYKQKDSNQPHRLCPRQQYQLQPMQPPQLQPMQLLWLQPKHQFSRNWMITARKQMSAALTNVILEREKEQLNILVYSIEFISYWNIADLHHSLLFLYLQSWRKVESKQNYAGMNDTTQSQEEDGGEEV